MAPESQRVSLLRSLLERAGVRKTIVQMLVAVLEDKANVEEPLYAIPRRLHGKQRTAQ